jgi:hypothetical protein
VTEGSLPARSRGSGSALSAVNGRISAAVAWPVAVATLCFTLRLPGATVGLDGYLDLVGGRLISSQGVPRADTLTVVGHGRAWVDQQWLAQLMMYGVWRVAGFVGLTFLLALLTAVTYGLLTHLMMRLGSPPQRAAMWSLLAFLGSAGYAAVRAEMFSYPLFVLVLLLLVRDLRRRSFHRSFLWTLFVLVAWANIHGAVLLGAALVVPYCAARAATTWSRGSRSSAISYATMAVAAISALGATPYGLSGAHYYRAVFSSSILREYEREWMSPRLTDVLDWMTFAFVVISLAVLVLAMRRHHRPNPVLLFATVVTGALALHATRYQPWFALAGASLAAATLAALRPMPPVLSPRFLRLGAAGLASVALVTAVSVGRSGENRADRSLNSGAFASAADWAREHPGALILTDDITSDRLLWSRPAMIGRVALDGRLDFYPTQYLRDWFSFIFGSELRTTVAGRRYQIFVASSKNRSLYRRLRAARCLRALHADAYGIAAVTRRPGSCG